MKEKHDNSLSKGKQARSKTALVLAGGGMSGGMYEIGALQAINNFLSNFSVNDFDIYVGTSAGAAVGASLANGIRPEMLLQGLNGNTKNIPAISHQHLYGFNLLKIMPSVIHLPLLLSRAGLHFMRNFRDMSLLDVGWSLLEGLPSGIFEIDVFADYLKTLLEGLGGTDRFDKLEKELFIVATNLENGSRELFSQQHNAHVPISKAVAASATIPFLWKPINIDGVEYLDGGLRGNASLDIAIEQGADLILCINPMVPFDNNPDSFIPFLGPNKEKNSNTHRHLSEKGLLAVLDQVFHISTNSSLHYHLKQLRRTYPDIEIILIEPDKDDYQMHFYNLMRLSARQIIVQHGIKSVTMNLAKNYKYIQSILARYDIELNEQFAQREFQKDQI